MISEKLNIWSGMSGMLRVSDNQRLGPSQGRLMASVFLLNI
jgi:hypothetical protein